MRCDANSLLQHFIEPGVHFLGQYRNSSILILERQKNAHQLIWQRDTVRFSRVIRISLAILHPDHLLCKVDLVHRNTCLRKAAAEISQDLKNGFHPFNMEGRPSNCIILRFKLRLFFSSFPLNFKFSPGILFAFFPSNSLPHNEGEKLHLQPCGVVRYGASGRLQPIWIYASSPFQKISSMKVPDLAWVLKISKAQPLSKDLPSVGVPLLTALIFEMGSKIAPNPSRKASRSIGAYSRLPLGFLVADALGFTGLLVVIYPLFSALLLPLASIQIAESNIPKRGAFMRSKGSHNKAHIVPQSLTFGKYFTVAACRNKWRNMGMLKGAEAYRYTTGQFNSLSFSTLGFSLRRDSQIRGVLNRVERLETTVWCRGFQGISAPSSRSFASHSNRKSYYE